MLTNEDKLWIELQLRKAHEKSDEEHKDDHGAIREVLDKAINRVYVVMVGISVAFAVAVAVIPFTISAG